LGFTTLTPHSNINEANPFSPTKKSTNKCLWPDRKD